MTFVDSVVQASRLIVRQKKELMELVGVETSNKYSIETEDGARIGFAAEQGTGVGAFIARQFLGHWRSYNILIFENDQRQALLAHHPFRFYFHELNIAKADSSPLGKVVLRYSIFSRKFDILGRTGELLLSMHSPFWKVWTFPITKNGRSVACIRKKWGGLGTELFLDADSFLVEFEDRALTQDERLLILASALFVDLRYFERKAGR